MTTNAEPATTTAPALQRFPLLTPAPHPPNGWDCHNDPAGTAGIQMCLLHNVIIRAMNNIHAYAPLLQTSPKPSPDIPSFILYCTFFLEFVHTHHHTEETVIFPFIQTKIDMSENIEQHKAFDEGVNVFEKYIKDVREGKEAFDGPKIRELVEAFGDILADHLHQEVGYFTPERLAVFEKEPFLETNKKLEAEIAKSSLTRGHAFLLTHHDFEAQPSWPPAPAPAMWILRNIAYWRYHSVWKFSSFERYGAPRAAYKGH